MGEKLSYYYAVHVSLDMRNMTDHHRKWCRAAMSDGFLLFAGAMWPLTARVFKCPCLHLSRMMFSLFF